ncbi:hypothetical protein [Desulforhabdus sp. TSK]|uniref:hypothetical protein n=1 Tax=Desulforhabdus sp. TSK TaxID=2925014 RepID=UPI001FC8BB67|nr:hypothetical protein [Desulforhabdus sp. TSK]GKT10043.1 hypothetical protein DSTSK_33480 [Desulforhabdus sp. TSK]
MADLIHSFHIPVMGTAFTIESPAKIAKYGISSVLSCVDDTLIERMRKFYCKMMGEEFIPIHKADPDARANRITAYLNLLDRIVKDQFEKLKASAFEIGSEITRYFELLADSSPLKQAYNRMLAMSNSAEKQRVQEELREKIRPGSIDVNIMTKLDRTNFDSNGEPLPGEFTDALAALRGYANSRLHSSIIFSAGFNGRLYSYAENFEDFHADENQFIKKKIVVKVNDYRSALTQGKFFAKKGLWVSEYRLESGLNCGGHAFGHGGNLMGPSLEEFKQKKSELVSTLFDLYNKARKQKGKKTFDAPHPVRITAQGGIGTAHENDFLLTYYNVDGTGWGTPFLLVPEATTVDHETLKKLCHASSEDLVLSNVSPLGIPFNNLRNSASEESKLKKIREGRPGSPCIKGHLVSNTEFTTNPICTASSLYQKQKLQQLAGEKMDAASLQEASENILAKACLCNDLAGAAMLLHQLNEPGDLPSTPAICPGPNLAYFSRTYTLEEMVDHIYGRTSLLDGAHRPNMFIAELDMYIDYLEREINDSLPAANDQRIKYFGEFRDNLVEGLAYYEGLIPKMTEETPEYHNQALADLRDSKKRLEALTLRHKEVFHL